jgi:lipopolysaccharide/colanic/teichoic acid biosynthesis glycosyltransferase
MEVLTEEIIHIAGLDPVTVRVLGPMKRRLKRAVDVVLALTGLILSLPIAALLALPIRLQSHGPVFYRQSRVGLAGRPFRVLKFRSMYSDADARLVALLRDHPELRAEYENFHKLKGDPRVTPIGQLMRRFSIDELPQLVNVLKGEMSIVGPRPYLDTELLKMADASASVLSVKPGLTGKWQVSGRNTLTFEDRVRLDLQYVAGRSIGGDATIFLRTFGVVLWGKGAG